MTVNPQKNEAKLEEIIDDEVAPNVGSRSRPVVVEKMVDITDLKEEEDDPKNDWISCVLMVHPPRLNLPVDIRDEGVQ